MEILFIIGRIIFGGYFAMSGLMHFMKGGMMRNYAASKGVPSPALAVSVTGLILLLSGIGFIFWIYVKWAVLLLAVFLIPVSFKMHAFWKEQDQSQKMIEMTNFMKNAALLGGALMALVY